MQKLSGIKKKVCFCEENKKMDQKYMLHNNLYKANGNKKFL